MSELIDREALKDAVKRYAGEPIKKKDRKCQAICLDMLGTIDAQPTASPWHRVEEELPKDGETVLIYCENTGGIVKSHYHEYRRAGKLVDFLFSGGAYFPKYWMPLPEPPKEENNA